MYNYDNIPNELKQLKQWVCWAGDKLPKNPNTGRNAQSNNSDTWGTYDEAIKAVEKYGFDGIGFMFANGYFGVDLDKCIDNQDFIDEFVETLGSYTEYSKSGQGIHIICKGKLPDGARRRGNVEMYMSGRYFIMTGNLYDTRLTEIKDCTESVKVLHSKYLDTDKPKIAPKRVEKIELSDSEIIEKARNCKSGTLFQSLYAGDWQGFYSSQSEADLALCNMLAFWTQKNSVQMDRIFRSSCLYRPKWDERRGQFTYGEKTISKAISGCTEVYDREVHTNEADLAIGVFGKNKLEVRKPRKEYDMTDTGNARRFVDKFGGNIRYSYVNKVWYFWDGKKWQEDLTGELKKLVDTVLEDMKREAFEEEEEEKQDALLKWATRTASSKMKENMLVEARHLDDVPVLPSALDSYPDFLNCQNGVINLRNGELIPHDGSFLMTKISYSDYDQSGAKPERWLQFLDEITDGDKELQHYIQKAVGYSLTGSIREQCAFFLYGVGNNGKTTFLDIISDICGTYAANVQPETIMLKRTDGTGANSDIARLKGARFVTSVEPNEGLRLNEGLVKQLTGGDRVTARFLYGKEFEFVPEFKIWIGTNHKPVIRGTDVGIWRRIRLIPFTVQIPKHKVDRALKYKLRKELPQILKWAVDGCIMWQKESLEPLPKCVKEATDEYKNEMDILASFCEMCIEPSYEKGAALKASDIYDVYDKWTSENNEFKMSNTKFGKEFSKKFPNKTRNADGWSYKEIKFTDYAIKLKGPAKRNYTIDDFR